MYPDYDIKTINSFRDLIEIMASDHNTDIAFSCINRNWTYGELVEQIMRVAASLIGIAQKKIRITMNDAVGFTSVYIATVLVGKVAVLGEDHLPASNDTIVITDDNLTIYINQEPLAISDLPEPNNTTLCTILHSSGTSSAPKGIMLSQKNLCSDVVGGLEKYSMRKGDRFINLIPYYHAFGLVCDLLGPFLVGATIYVLENKKLFLAEMSRIKPTVINVPPIIAEMLLKLAKTTENVDTLTGGCLRKILCGGAGLKATVAQKLRNYGIYAYGCYGLSECSPCVAVNRDDCYKDGSAGVPLNCNKVSIAEDGEILISGTNVMLGYYNDPEATNAVIKDGVLHTGDLGYIDQDGFLFVTGRKRNLIVFSDGTKCCPETIEEQIIINTPAEEVLVYQSKNTARATLSAKIYILDDSAKGTVKEYIKNRLTTYNFDDVEFTLEPLPKNATGKIRRNI